MLFTPLTAEETAQSKKAMEAANKQLKAEYKKIAEELKLDKTKLYRDKLKILEAHREKYPAITGHPVIIAKDGIQLPMDYELLRKIANSLERDKRDFLIDLEVTNSSLIFNYHQWGDLENEKNRIEVYQLPEYQRVQLKELPIINIL